MVRGSKREILKLVGESMRARRLSANLSQQDSAERSGISLSTLKNLESGRGSSAWALISLCRTYGFDSWVAALAPEESLEAQVRAEEGNPRQRASKRRRAARHV